MSDSAANYYNALHRDKLVAENVGLKERVRELEAEVSQWKASMGMAIAERDEVITELEAENQRLRNEIARLRRLYVDLETD